MNERDGIISDPETEFQTFVLKADLRVGPLTNDEIMEGLENGIYGYDDLCWREGMTGWTALETIFPKPEAQIFASPAKSESFSKEVAGTVPVESHFGHSNLKAWRRVLQGLPRGGIGIAAVVLAIAVFFYLHRNPTIVGTWKEFNHSHNQILVIDEKHYFELLQENNDVVKTLGKCVKDEGKYQLSGFDHKGAPVKFGSLELKWNGNELKVGDDIYRRTGSVGVTHSDFEEGYTNPKQTAETHHADEAKSEAIREKNSIFFDSLMDDADEDARTTVQSEKIWVGIPSSPPAVGDIESVAEQRWNVYEYGDMKKRNFPSGYSRSEVRDGWIKQYIKTYIATLKPLIEENQRKQAPAF